MKVPILEAMLSWLKQIFMKNKPKEILGRNAEHEQGAASVLVGIAANQSILEGTTVKISDLVALAPRARKLSELR